MLTHRNILSNAVAATQIFPIGPKQRLLSFLPLSHMFEQLAGFFTVLLSGASVIYPTSRQPAVVRRTFKERKVSMVLITPAVVKSLMLAIERSAEAQGKKELFQKLRGIARRLPMPLRRDLSGPKFRQGCKEPAKFVAFARAWKLAGAGQDVGVTTKDVRSLVVR